MRRHPPTVSARSLVRVRSRRRFGWGDASDVDALDVLVGFVMGFLFWAFVPAVALYMVSLTPSAWEATRAAARGEGQRGTFVAEREDCERSGCSWYGRYVSEDGTTRFDDVLIDAGPSRVGDSIPALYEVQTDPPKVYTADGSKDWVWVLLLASMAASYLAGCGFLILRRLKGKFGHPPGR